MELMIEQDRYAEGSDHIRQIRLRRPEINSTLLALEAGLLIDAQEYYPAFTFLSRAISNYPNDIQLIQLRTVVSQELDDFAILELDLRSIMRLEPNNPSPFNTLGYFLADRTTRYNEAKELIDRAMELSPNDPAIIDSLGWVQFKLGMYEESKINLERAFELFPDHEVAAHLGEVLWVMGNREAAREIWEVALEDRPDSEFILSTMQRLNAESDS
jgi:tetratricopeptide (TPR) repeat protein